MYGTGMSYMHGGKQLSCLLVRSREIDLLKVILFAKQ